MKLNKRIRTVLYEDQRFSSAELELLHTPAFQRLYDLHQLGLTDRIFLDASHSRLHHVVGVVEQATNLMESLERNLRSKPDVRLDYTGGLHDPAPSSGQFALLVKRRIPAARLMAMLHDLTHTPYGHTLEDEIRLVEEKHDEPKRQAEAFYRVAIQFIGWLWRNSLPIEDASVHSADSNHRALADHLNEYLDWPDLVDPKTDADFIDFVASTAVRLIKTADARRSRQPFLRLGTSDLTQFMKELSFAMRALLFLEAAHKDEIKLKLIPDAKYPFDKLFDLIFQKLAATRISEEEFSEHRDAFMLDVIGNTICADLLDYAKRDAFNAGLKLNYDANRIIENFTLISHAPKPERVKVVDNNDNGIRHPFEHHSIRTAISLFGHKLRTDVPGELLNLLQVRYYVYERMLYHPTKCIAGAMLGAAVQLVGWKSLPPHFQLTGDAVFLHDARDAAKIVDSLLDTCPDKSSPYTFEICEQLKRKLPVAPATSATRNASFIAHAGRACATRNSCSSVRSSI